MGVYCLRHSRTDAGNGARWHGMLPAWLCLLLAFALGMPAALAEEVEELTLGFFAYRPKALLEERWQPLVEYLNDHLPGEVHLRLRVLGQAEMKEALQRGELHYLFTNPSHYIELRTISALSGALVTQITLEEGQPVSRLGGVVIRRADRDGPDTFEELRGKRIAIAGKQYLGAYTAPALELQKRGIAPEKLDYLVTGQVHDLVVQAVLDGRADAGFIRTGIIEQMLREGTLKPGQIEVLEPQVHDDFPFVSSTALYPEWALVAMPEAPEPVSRRLTSLLLGLEPDHPVAVAAGIHGFTIPADYLPVREAMVSLRLPPFDQVPEFGWQDIWQRYTGIVAVGVLATLIIIALVLALMVGNRRLRASRKAAQRLGDRLRAIIDGTRTGTWEWNVQTDEAVFNRRWAGMLGYRLEELEPVFSKTWTKFVHPDDQPVARAALQRHFDGEVDMYDVEVRMRHRDGHWIWVRNRGQLFSRTAEGKPMWMFGTHVDVSERYQATRERDELLHRFEELSRNIPGALYQYRQCDDGHFHFPFVSPGIEDICGCTPEQAVGDAQAVFAAIHPDDFERVKAAINRSGRELTTWHDVYRVRHPRLGELWVENSATPARHEDGCVVWHGYVKDITELHESRERIRLAAQVFEASQEGIMITDACRFILDVNSAFTEITGYELREVQGEIPSLLRSGYHSQAFYDELYLRLETDGFWRGEVWDRHKSGKVIPLLLSIATVTDDEGEVQYYVANFTDISAIKAHEEELHRIANYDALTDIPNRRLLGDRLQQSVAQALRTGQTLAVCMLDLDGFKPVNDRYGHQAGDKLLVEIARRLKSWLRAEDTVARLGGDEFVLLLRNPEGPASFDRILDIVRQPIHLAEGTVRVTASMGVAYLDPANPCDGDQLLRQADQGLYQAKALGCDHYNVYDVQTSATLPEKETSAEPGLGNPAN